MSVSQHPIALRLEQQVGEGTRLLATVMGLPLIDGIFPALVLAGVLSSPLGIIEVGLLVFGGSATLAVVLAEMEGSRREQVASVLVVGVLLMCVAAAEAAIAPTIESALEMTTFKRFAALVILAVAAKTASATVGEYLPSPGVIVGLGLVASLDPSGFQFALIADPMDVLRGVAAAGVGVAFALGAAVFAPWLRGNVDIDRFRFGSAVALGVLPLTILEIIQTDVPIALAVLAVTSLLALDPEGAVDPTDQSAADAAVADGGDEPADDAPTSTEPDSVDEEPHVAVDDEESGSTDPSVGSDRAPWL